MIFFTFFKTTSVLVPFVRPSVLYVTWYQRLKRLLNLHEILYIRPLRERYRACASVVFIGSLTEFEGVNEFIPYFPHFLTGLDEIRYRITPCNDLRFVKLAAKKHVCYLRT
jgi:hypothetical protein